MAFEYTGERFVPGSPHCSAALAYEHWHRYAYAARFVENKAVLDIASGEGYGSYHLALRAGSVLGVDISQESVLHARSEYRRENLEFRQGSAAAIPVAGEGVFDVVVSFETIEHIDVESQRAFLREVRRLLKRDGVFIVSSPDKRTFSDERNYVNEFHVKEFYHDEFREFLSESFAYVRIIGQGVHAVSYMSQFDVREGPFVELGVARAADGALVPRNEPAHHLYLIALCSNARMVEAPFSLLVDKNEAVFEEHEANARRYIAEVQRRDDYISTLEQALGARDERIGELERALVAKDEKLTEIGATLSRELARPLRDRISEATRATLEAKVISPLKASFHKWK